MTEIDLSRAEWQKSSYSGQSGNCVEVARNLPEASRGARLKGTRRGQAGGLTGDLEGLHQERARLTPQICRFPVNPSDSRASFPAGFQLEGSRGR